MPDMLALELIDTIKTKDTRIDEISLSLRMAPTHIRERRVATKERLESLQTTRRQLLESFSKVMNDNESMIARLAQNHPSALKSICGQDTVKRMLEELSS